MQTSINADTCKAAKFYSFYYKVTMQEGHWTNHCHAKYLKRRGLVAFSIERKMVTKGRHNLLCWLILLRWISWILNNFTAGCSPGFHHFLMCEPLVGCFTVAGWSLGRAGGQGRAQVPTMPQAFCAAVNRSPPPTGGFLNTDNVPECHDWKENFWIWNCLKI